MLRDGQDVPSMFYWNPFMFLFLTRHYQQKALFMSNYSIYFGLPNIFDQKEIITSKRLKRNIIIVLIGLKVSVEQINNRRTSSWTDWRSLKLWQKLTSLIMVPDHHRVRRLTELLFTCMKFIKKRYITPSSDCKLFATLTAPVWLGVPRILQAKPQAVTQIPIPVNG